MKNMLYFAIISLFLFNQAERVFAQIEDEFEELDEQEVEDCLPESLMTSYDKLELAEVSLNDIKLWNSFGSEHFKNKNYKACLPYLWKVFIKDSTRYANNAISKITQAYFNMQMADSTLIACYRGLIKFPFHMTLHYYAGFLQDNLGKFRCAIPHYEALVKENPKNEKYLEKLAFLYYKDDNEKAIKTQANLVELDQTNSSYQETYALYIQHFGGSPKDAYRDAYLNDPKDIDIAMKYGESAYNEGSYKEAIQPLSDVIKNDANNVKAYRIRAMCRESLEDYQASISDYKKILEIEPQNAVIMCAIANNYRNLNNFSNGKYWIQKALNAKPGFGLAYITMGEIFEHSVTYCQNLSKRDRKYDDGYVYGLALAEYNKASRDEKFTIEARKRMKSLKPYLLTDEEKFMHTGTDLKLECYGWIK